MRIVIEFDPATAMAKVATASGRGETVTDLAQGRTVTAGEGAQDAGAAPSEAAQAAPPPPGAEGVSAPQGVQDAGAARREGAESVSPPIVVSPPVVRVDATPGPAALPSEQYSETFGPLPPGGFNGSRDAGAAPA
jgi:hypothetical protein